MSSVALVVAIHAIPTCASVGVAAAHAMRGVALASAHRHAEAVDALELSLAIRPEHAPTHVNLGLVWEQVGLPAAALNSYAEAIRISPRMASAYERFGGLLAQELGQIALAEEALQTSIRLEPTRADGWKGLGKLLHSAGSLDRAGDALKMALALAPSEHSIQHNLATVLRAQPGLAMHVDDSEISFNLLLANPRDFAGGGTFFEAAHSTVRPKQGGMLTHFGLLRHAGTPVSQALTQLSQPYALMPDARGYPFVEIGDDHAGSVEEEGVQENLCGVGVTWRSLKPLDLGGSRLLWFQQRFSSAFCRSDVTPNSEDLGNILLSLVFWACGRLDGGSTCMDGA
ncbi:hypothetical protein AB1Y20_011661 [Prymnesium parvum]|uniref:Prolyl 4-hydroxylase alpha subunit domain-containing protein n=1 Tax=Prymnesium parvum TaxID=97485 RepID=A0AB34IK16_PRYPA